MWLRCATVAVFVAIAWCDGADAASWQFGSQAIAAMPAPRASSAAPVQPAPVAQNDSPVFPSPDVTPHNDGLDDWCRGDIAAVNVAVCGDAELRALAVQRLGAFGDAKAHLSADQQNVLAADQNGWAMSYPQACGLRADVRPPLPLPLSIKECMLRAGQARLAYLRSYAANAAASTKPQGAANPAIVSPQKQVVIPPVLTPPPAPASDTASTSSSSPQPPSQPAAGTPPQPSTDTAPPAAKPTPATDSAPPKPASHDPFATDAAPSLGTLQGKATLVIALLAAGLVMLWVIVLLRRARSHQNPAE